MKRSEHDAVHDAADFLHAGAHHLYRGVTAEIPYLKRQQRLTFARVGVIELARVGAI